MRDATTRYRRTMKEHHIEAAIVDGVRNLGGYAWHIRDSRKQNVVGAPDLLLIKPPYVALIEAKSQYRDVTDTQAHVLEMLQDCNEVISGIVRPVPKPGESDLDTMLQRLGVKTT